MQCLSARPQLIEYLFFRSATRLPSLHCLSCSVEDWYVFPTWLRRRQVTKRLSDKNLSCQSLSSQYLSIQNSCCEKLYGHKLSGHGVKSSKSLCKSLIFKESKLSRPKCTDNPLKIMPNSKLNFSVYLDRTNFSLVNNAFCI